MNGYVTGLLTFFRTLRIWGNLLICSVVSSVALSRTLPLHLHHRCFRRHPRDLYRLEWIATASSLRLRFPPGGLRSTAQYVVSHTNLYDVLSLQITTSRRGTTRSELASSA